MSHHHHHEHPEDPARWLSQDFWDERYRSVDRLWSGGANPQLVANVESSTPGRALDVGSGEGADAIWLAEQGWQVTAVDISVVALERGAQRAAEVGTEVAARISWAPADVLTWVPEPSAYDLVSAQFMHLGSPQRESLHRRLAAAVRPGGSLLIVGHHPSDLETTVGRPDQPNLMPTAEQVGATLDRTDWDILRADAPARETRDPDGQLITIRDAVLLAIRRTTNVP